MIHSHIAMGGFICHGYICILLYLQLISCTGVGEMYGHLDGGVHLPWVYLHSSISATYLMYWCSRDVCSCGWGVGVHLPLVYLNSSISATYFMYWCSTDLWSFVGGSI